MRRPAGAARDRSCLISWVGVTRDCPKEAEQKPILKMITPRCDRLRALSRLDNAVEMTAAPKFQYEASRHRLLFGERPMNYSEKAIDAEQRLKGLQIDLPA